jgi:hypothetical protein
VSNAARKRSIRLKTLRANTRMSQRKKKRDTETDVLTQAEIAADDAAPEEPIVMPRNHRELAQAIFAGKSPVQVGRDLLNDTSEKGASVRMRVFETFVDWLYGPHRAASADQGVRIIWDIPGPANESEEAAQ